MKLIRALLKPLSFVPALCLMYMIFSFSAQDGATSSALSYKVSYKIVEVGAKVLGENLEPYQIDSLATRFHGLVRKIAHMTEYFALAVSVAFPLYVYGLRGIWLMLVAGLICVAFACGDEYHQSFVSGRSPSKRDVAIDSFGVFWGIVLARIVGWTGRKTIFRPFSDEALQKREEKKARKKQKKAAQKNSAAGANQAGYQPHQGAPQGGYVPQGNTYGYPQNNGYAPYSGNTYDNSNGYTPYPNNGYEAPQNVSPYQASQNGYAPQKEDGYNEPQPAGYPYPNNPNGYTPYQANGYDAPQSNGYPYQNQTGGYAPYPYNNPQQNGYAPYPEMDDSDDDYVSDKLSEDMSFRKLMHDIKDQKQERHNAGKHPVHKAE